MFQRSANYIVFLTKVKRERRPFLERARIDLSSKLSLTYGINVNHYKSVHHPLSNMPVRIGNTRQLSEQISKLFFQVSVQVYSLLSQTEGERKTFFRGWKKWGYIVSYCCLLDPLTNKNCRGWSSMINLWIDSRICQKESCGYEGECLINT